MRASARGVVGKGRLGSGLGSLALVSLVGVGRLLPCIGEGWPAPLAEDAALEKNEKATAYHVG